MTNSTDLQSDNDNDAAIRCPRCGGAAHVVGGHCFGGNSVDYIECAACGYSGDRFEEDGVIYDIVPNGNTEDYVRRYNKIASDPANIELAERTRAARLREWQEELKMHGDEGEPF